MTPSEAAQVLTKAAAYDRRTVGRADAMAWAEALDDIDPAEAFIAVARHYRVSTDWLMPAHVRQQVEEIRAERARRDRIAAAVVYAPPVSIERSEATKALIRELRDALPDVGREILRRAQWVDNDRRRERHLRAVPNPHFVAAPPPEGFPMEAS